MGYCFGLLVSEEGGFGELVGPGAAGFSVLVGVFGRREGCLIKKIIVRLHQ